ncbi:MAG TPA: class I SAM-dependent methyltransferase [Gemmatimonadetes bacterium]|nr:class I SAM-dependent methyltransferase [Gemmatimonadota bacterium]
MSKARIDKDFYDSSDYFEEKADHLLDLNSGFQRYRVSRVLAIHLPNGGDRVIDVGCGWGTFSFALADRVAEVVGIDFSEKSVEICNHRLVKNPHQNLRFLCSDAGDTGLEGGTFDVAIAADIFEHLYPDDSEKVALEMHRLLKPGGHFSIWTPHRGHVLEVMKNRNILLKRDPSHVDYKSMASLKRLLIDAGFQIERAYFAESHIPGLRSAERLLQGIIPFLRRRIAILARKPKI